MRIAKLFRTIGGSAVVAAVFAFLTIGVGARIINTSAPETKLIAGVNFALSASILDHPSCAGSEVLLTPGQVRCLQYTVQNPLPDAITISSISAVIDPAFAAPAGCETSNLDLSQAGFNGSPAFVVPGNGTGSVNRQISLINTPSSQDGCKNVAFHLKYDAEATYVHVYSTATALTSAPNPSIAGNVFTLTATVTTPSQTPPGPPTGNVTFKDGSTTITCGSGSTGLSNGVQTCKYSTYVVGPHSFTAAFSNTPTSGPADGNFSGSTSSALTHNVSYSSCVNGNQNGNLVVASGQAVCIASSGKVHGTVTVQSGGALYVNGGTVQQAITVQSGGALFIATGSSINSNINVTSPQVLNICGAKKINGGISVSGASSMVLIGDGTASCKGNDIQGSVTLTNNTAGYKIVGNTFGGSITVNNNSGNGLIAANKKVSNLTCAGNTPAPTNGGQPNQVTGARTGQCASL